MRQFLLRRLGFALLSLVGATVFVFSLSRMGPDPRYLYIPDTGGVGITKDLWDRLGREMGLDKPLPVQYLIWLGNLLRGDLGESIGTLRPVGTIIADKMGATLTLAFGGWLFAILVGVPLGVLAAVKRGTLWDYVGRVFALFGQALPPFWTGVISILVFAVILRWLPPGTRGEYVGFPLAWGHVKYYVLPCIVLGWPASAGIMRLTRSAMLEVLDSEFVKFARAKGVAGQKVLWKHALRNSLIPPLTSALVILGTWLNGALVVETVFSWPGIGWIALNRAVYQNDFPLLVGTVLFFTSIFLLFAFLADLAYAFIDPRIRYK